MFDSCKVIKKKVKSFSPCLILLHKIKYNKKNKKKYIYFKILNFHIVELYKFRVEHKNNLLILFIIIK